MSIADTLGAHIHFVGKPHLVVNEAAEHLDLGRLQSLPADVLRENVNAKTQRTTPLIKAVRTGANKRSNGGPQVCVVSLLLVADASPPMCVCVCVRARAFVLVGVCVCVVLGGGSFFPSVPNN